MKKAVSYIICFIIFFAACKIKTQAQEGIIKGRVQAKEEVLIAATISVGKKTVLTNNNGEFLISINPGIYTLTISYTGYQTISKGVTVKAGETIELSFALESAEQMNEVVVLGSRSAIKRSSMNNAVPVDVINGSKLPVAATSLTEKLFITVPSFHSSPQTVGATVYVNPATLRGLGTDETLVLINGQRRHTAAILVVNGGVATDLNCIPAAAIEHVQILRDGAAAQYGSDGIAGVMDIQLKKSTGITKVNLHLGQLYKGDGETISLDVNRGFNINKKSLPTGRQGFINFTVAANLSKPTQRNGIYDSTVYENMPPANASQWKKDSVKARDDSIVLAHGFDRLNHRRIGSPQIFNSSLIVNGGYPVTKKTNLFFTGTMNFRYTTDRGSNAYRYPKNPATVIKELYPDGFGAKFFATTFNASITAGIEGETNNGWHWNLSSVYGGNLNKLLLTNTNNASQFALGKNAPTHFHPGKVSFIQNNNNLNLTRSFTNLSHNIKSFTVSFGGEFRIENYQIKQGDSASWYDYAPGSGRQRGSQGVGGYSPDNAINKNRYVKAAYLEIEMDRNEKFLWNLAGRYEHYSDFGGNIAGKLAMRYKFSDRFLLRGSFSNGFRAPALQQRYFSNTSAMLARNLPTVSVTETFRNDSYVAEAFGVAPLQAEKSLNISGGVTSRISQHVNITLDAYWIQIRNRVTFTGSIRRDKSDSVNRILESLNKNDVLAIRFFSNAISTRTKGVDLVITAAWPIRKSILEVSLSANYNKTNIYRINQPAKNLPDDSLHQWTLISREERGRIELSQPLDKIILLANYKTGKWNFGFSAVYFGKAAHLAANRDTTSGTPPYYPDEYFTPKMLSDCNVAFSPKPWIIIRIGARNILNTYPDKIKYRVNTQGGLVIYDFNGTQIGYNGGYYFVNISLNF